MNFFHFDNAEMTLRHITLFGVRLLYFYWFLVLKSDRSPDGHACSTS